MKEKNFLHWWWLVVYLVAPATGFAQQEPPATEVYVTLDLRNAGIHQLIKQVKRQTAYQFGYAAPDIRHVKGINYSGARVSLDEVFKTILPPYKLQHKIYQNFIILTKVEPVVIPQVARRDPYTLVGYVQDEDGIPIQGVNVMIAGKETGVVSDLNGKFTLTNVREQAEVFYPKKVIEPDGRSFQ